MTYDQNQLAKLAYNAGFRGDALRWAVAVALAESGGNPAAYNPEIAAGTVPGSGSRGLWQIYGTAHPEYNSALAFDPVTNAQAAYKVYREAGNQFTPWSTFNNGSAANYYRTLKISSNLSGVSVPSTPSSGGAPSKDVSVKSGQQGTTPEQTGWAGISGSLQDIASGAFITKIFEKVDKVSLTFYIMGVALMLIGLIVLLAKPASQVAIAGVRAAQFVT